MQDFLSYRRLVTCAKESAGTRHGLLRQHEPGEAYFAKLERNHGKSKALIVLAQKVARAVSHMLTRKQALALQRCVTASPLRATGEPAVSLAPQGARASGRHTPPAAPTASSLWMCGPEPQGLIGCPFPLPLPGDSSSGAPARCPATAPMTHGTGLRARARPSAWTRIGEQMSF